MRIPASMPAVRFGDGGAAAGAAAAAALSAQQAAMTQALRQHRSATQSGPFVHVEPNVFVWAARQTPNQAVVAREGGQFFGPNNEYMTNAQGFTFYTKSSTPLELAPGTLKIPATQMYIA